VEQVAPRTLDSPVFLPAGNARHCRSSRGAADRPFSRERRYRPAMRFGPPVFYTHNQGGSRLAYQVLGDGDLDLVFLFGWPTHLALMWENPAFADFLHGLAAFSRLILFDRLGTGMSDRGPTGRAFEEGMDDIRTVLRAVDSERTSFLG
jgi:hypothetical protein